MAQSTLKAKPLENVAITGGTHGNELLGIYLVRHWMTNDTSIKRQSFNTHLGLNNTRAIEKCVRYIDTDLNRVFSKEGVIPNENVYELQRACEIQKWVLDRNVDYLIDVHDTTANTGVTLILTPSAADNMLTLQILAKVKENLDFPVRVLSFKSTSIVKDKKGQNSGGGILELTGSGLGLENGPVSHGTIKADMYQQTATVIGKVLDVIEEFNNGLELNGEDLEVFEFSGIMQYPKDNNGNVMTMIHPKLDGKDWVPIKRGDPIFMTFDERTIKHEGEQEIIPVFINEASYVEKDIAFFQVERVHVKLQPVQKI
ncbi:Aspartoacylase [Exaiptasia diaphana]|nr:Aspartoacylase [Exaiptasia diaphana]